MKKALIAFGGNALIKAGELNIQTQQLENAKEAAEMVSTLLDQGLQPIIVHGNGPQVGNLLIQQDAAANRVPPYTMDICGAQTQGAMGFMLERCVENMLRMKKYDFKTVTLLTEVLVDGNDTGFKNPTKPVGPFYEAFRARELENEKGWVMKEDSGRGWRRLVPSPRPLQIVQMDAIKLLVENRYVVLACGGGGIPLVADRSGFYMGVEAVIDKDRTSAMLAHALGVDVFINLTGVDKVCINFGTPHEKRLDVLTVSEARRHLEDGQFPPGSMGPKIQSAIRYIEAGGREVLITTAESLLMDKLEDIGTRIIPD